MNKSIHQPTIGGYFGLNLPLRNVLDYHKNCYSFQSARAAFRALIQVESPSRVWMPKFICDAMLEPLYAENISIGWYDLDEYLFVRDDIKLSENELLLYVNYFGICDRNIARLKKIFPPEQLILDYSQAFYSKPDSQVVATIYSPRKFFGVPDGGMMVTNSHVVLPDEEDELSVFRMPHLIKRLYLSPEEGYEDYLASEKSLENSAPKRISKLTSRLLQSVDYLAVKRIREDNFTFLNEKLGSMNLLQVSTEEITAPLCYPFMANNRQFREELIQSRVYIPTYWKDALKRVSVEWGREYIDGLLALPIDQRYGRSDLQNLVSMISEDSRD